MHSYNKVYLLVFLMIFSLSNNYAQEDLAVNELMDLSLENLMKVEVISASNKIENLDKAPATIIVITEQEIEERGYFELYDVLNDLPGFDLSRAFGDDNYYAYVRGYRKTTSDQMLLMIDGMIMNHLYNNNMVAYAQYPLQSIKQIEIVYGPASAIYGPNAFTGVINMITKKEGGSTVQAALGQNNTNIVDLHVSEKFEEIGINFSGRLYQSNGPDLEGRTPMLDEEHFTNPYYWGDFAQTDFLGYKSPIQSNFIHPSINFKGLTVGSINYFYESGLGAEFAGGTVLNSPTWQFKENTFYAKYEKSKDNFKSKTLLKYRKSDVPGTAAFIQRWVFQGFNDAYFVVAPGATLSDPLVQQSDDPSDLMRVNLSYTNTNTVNDTLVVDNYRVSGEYWQATNASYSFFQDFTYSNDDNLTINFGMKYDRRVLNRDYVKNRVRASHGYVHHYVDSIDRVPLNPAFVSSTTFPFPDQPIDQNIDQENHNTLTDRGAYVQARINPTNFLTIFTGLRYDNNSVWKGVWSPRVGIVAELSNGLITKAFFGTAFLEPSARILYGGWQGSLSNDQLVPEKMRTFEVSTTYTKENFSTGLNGFLNSAPDAIGQGSGKVPINLGKRRMFGLEANAKYLIHSDGKFFSKLRSDLYVSYISSEEDLADTGNFKETGNMAPIKVKFIVTGFVKDLFSISLQNRYISEIKTVATNPIKTIDSHLVNDLFLSYNNLPIEGFSIGLKVYNLLNMDYFHPGYRDADAGESGVNNALISSSWYNSRLPQSERTVLMSLKYML